MRPVVSGLLAAIGVSALLSGCAQQVGDIDRTQANLIEKAQLDGVWYMMDTVTDLPATSRASFIGETSRTEKIVWVVEENLLLAYRAYPLVPGTDNVDRPTDYGDPDYRESPIAAFSIKSHFDVQRDYNTTTGEQSNVIIENSRDRLWYERDYMRVNWSDNLITNFDFVSDWLWTPIETSFFQDTERDLERSLYFEYDDDGELVYFDAPRRVLVEPDLYGCIISSPWYGWGYEDCAPAEVEITTAFARTEPRRDYEPLPYSDRELTRFGLFRSERYVYDAQRGVLESTRSRMANIHNLWEQSYRRDAEGELLRAEDGRLVPIPLAERQVRTAPFYRSQFFPADPLIGQAAVDTIAQWNAVFRETVALAQGTAIEQVPDVFVLCYNPVSADDHSACGPEGFTVRPGDLRYNVLYWVESEQLEGPLGYGPVASDPETGEVISSRTYVYGASMNRYAAYGVDVIRFLNGDLDPDDLRNAEHIREQVLARADRTTNLDRVDPRLREMRLDSRRVRDPVRMQAREYRRRNLRHFDRQAAMNRIESLRSDGISRMIGGDELEQAIAGRLGRPPAEIDAATWDAVDAARWLSPTHLNDIRRRRLAAMARGVDYADMIDPHVVGLARSYAGRTDYDQIWAELRAEIFRATALHEVGHTLGLRHNFQGTYDSLNYHDEYWNLRRENLFEAEFMYDLYELNALTEAQIDGRMREYQYSSIMDYGYTFNTDTQGLGKYDRAAIVYAYSAGSNARPVSEVGDCSGIGRVLDPSDPSRCLQHEMGFVEVFRKRQAELGRAGQILTSRDEGGQRYDDFTSPGVPLLERWHYTTFIQSFPAIDDAFDREWMRMGNYLARRDDGDDAPVRVPYLFCGDEWSEAILSCQLFDAGADPFEMTKTIIDNYRNYYYFQNFKRDRLGWDVIDALFTNFSYTFLPLSNYFQNWYLAPEGADEVMDNYYWLSINMGFNTIAQAIATPPYGSFCTSRDGGSLVNLSDEAQFNPETASDFVLNAYCDRDAPFHEVPQGDGRRPFTAYDFDEGYNFGFLPLEAGHYWTTLAAFWALTDPEAYVLGTDADLGTFSISHYDFFGDETHSLVNAVFSEDYGTYSPTIEVNDTDGAHRGILHYPVYSPVWDSDIGLSINPETGESVVATSGPSGDLVGICEACNSGSDCVGSTGFTGGVYCQPIDDGGTWYCLQDCFDDASLCANNETCNESGNCAPTNGVCVPRDCAPNYPNGSCPDGQSCREGECQEPWLTVETDATLSIMDDMMFYGMLYTTFGYSTRYNDQIAVFKMGTEEEIEPGEGFEVVTFTDPISGEAFGALQEVCDAPEGLAGQGGATAMCEPCEDSEQCAGYSGDLGGAWCQPIADESDDVWYCLVDCSESDNCPDGTTCSEGGNCVPDGTSCGDLVGPCSVSNPLGSCEDGSTCVAGACTPLYEASTRCQLDLSEPDGGAQMVARGRLLAERYNETLATYWEDDESDPELSARITANFSRARFDLENHLTKLNVIRAVYEIFALVY